MRIAVTAATALLLALSIPAGAQQAANPMTHDSTPKVEGPAATPAEVERLIGTDAVAADGRKVGKIENLLVTPEGRVDYVVLEWGGVLGLGERQVAVPWKDVALNADGSQAIIDMSKDQLEQAQRYDPDVPAAAGIDSEIKPLR
jgi:sporulation protein YlmC with PRC-barrel domain